MRERRTDEQRSSDEISERAIHIEAWALGLAAFIGIVVAVFGLVAK